MSIADDKAVLEEGTAFSPKFDAAGLIVFQDASPADGNVRVYRAVKR